MVSYTMLQYMTPHSLVSWVGVLKSSVLQIQQEVIRMRIVKEVFINGTKVAANLP